MKKVLFLLAALVVSVSSMWADPVYPEAGKTYKMHCLAASGHTDAQYVSITNEVITHNSATGSNFIFEDAGENKWYIKDAGSDKYLYVASATSGTAITLSAEATTYWTAGGPFHTNGIRLYPNGDTSCWMNNNSAFALKTGPGECSSWVLEEVLTGSQVKTLADLNPNKLYTISSQSRGSFVYASSYSATNLSGSKRANYNSGNLDATDANFQFAFVQEGDKYYLWSKGANKFAAYANPNVTLSETLPAAGLTFKASTGDTKADYPVVLAIDGSHEINMSTDQHQGLLTNWNDTGDAGNMLNIVPVADLTNEDKAAIEELLHPTNRVDITYDYYIDGVKFDSETINCKKGEAFPEPTKIFTGYTISGKPETLVEAEGTRSLTLTDFAGPFVPTTIVGDDFAEGTKWYYMQNGLENVYGYVYYLNDATKMSGFDTNEVNNPVRKWAFVRKQGTPYFYLYNKAAGTVAMREQLSATQSYAEKHNQGFVVADESKIEMPLQLIANGVGFTLRLAAYEGNCILGHHTNSSGYKLSIWGNSASLTDDGSRFTFTVAPEDVVGNDWTLYQNRLNALEAYTVGTGLGEYACTIYEQPVTASQMSFYKDAWQETLNEQEEGYYTTHMNEMNEALASMQLNMPQPGQFFRIKTSSNWIATPTYLKGEQNSSNRVLFTQDAAEIAGTNTIFCYFLDPKTNGKYLVCYGNGMTAANNSNFMGMKRYPSTTSIAFQAATTGEKVGKYNIKFAGSRFLYTNNGLYGDAGSGSTAEGYNFVFEEVTELPVAFHENGKDYATLYAPVALTIPAGVEAYTLTEEGEYLKANAIEDVIPANTGVVLKATAGETKNFAITTEAGTAEAGVLTGTVPAIAKVNGSYVFSIVGEHEGFYQFGGNDLAGFKAYYVSGNTEVQGFVIDFGGMTTGINAAQQAQSQKASFDLQGRRISKAVRGLFIQNGQKVIR